MNLTEDDIQDFQQAIHVSALVKDTSEKTLTCCFPGGKAVADNALYDSI
jgi:hypothetical protein